MNAVTEQQRTEIATRVGKALDMPEPERRMPPVVSLPLAPTPPALNNAPSAGELLVLKHREFQDAFGDLPQRSMIALGDAARRSLSETKWERVLVAFYDLIGDPK